MEYLYENLGDERFQQFCSSLISCEYQNVQSFPVGQPDGGRDTLVRDLKSEGDTIIFQVKFTRNPHKVTDAISYLTKIIDDEKPKIEKLAQDGAKSYVLITNLFGSGHYKSGSKDKIQAYLSEHIAIPAMVWWRDDISIRLEKYPLLKWTFPQVISGQDILNSLVFNSFTNDKKRLESIVNAYLKDQYDIDEQVKFKQIDLQNNLLQLFTDVPISVRRINQRDKKITTQLSALSLLNTDDFDRNDTKIGAAEFILGYGYLHEINKILIEGAPGQGKSTISQFVCQVHRSRLLNKNTEVEKLSNFYRDSRLRFPLKIDLRDISLWIENQNPYKGIVSEHFFTTIWSKSLETFLIAHLSYHSRFSDFSLNDVISILQNNPTLIVFDGFDEIASVTLRADVVRFIDEGLSRLSANVKDIQILITSRPAALANNTSFSSEIYPHFKLNDLNDKSIYSYLEKWIKSSKLDIRESEELKHLVFEKIQLQHLKDLTKTTMQLAIFITLLRKKGQALPNKRTALYDSYITLFFDRESEKSELIRTHRELIIEIHEYLAWILHSEAEQFSNNGSMEVSLLNEKLKHYLIINGHKTDISDELFTALKERVCALVSRVQGTFEFEVQPLREFFAAKYLYKTAPYSTTLHHFSGSKPDRFRAILRHFYWQNVVRFFAGCVDAGEIDMVISEIKDFSNDNQYRLTNLPSIVTLQLLSDYVFSQKPLKLNSVVDLLNTSISSLQFSGQDANLPETILLAEDCGGKVLYANCFLLLSRLPKQDFAEELLDILRLAPYDERLREWENYFNLFSAKDRTRWISFGRSIRVFDHIGAEMIQNILSQSSSAEINIQLNSIFSDRNFHVLDSIPELKATILNNILGRTYVGHGRIDLISPLALLIAFTNPHIEFYMNYRNGVPGTFLTRVTRFTLRNESADSIRAYIRDIRPVDQIDEKIIAFINKLEPIFDVPISEFRKDINHWELYISSLEEIFGETKVAISFGTVACASITKKVIQEQSLLQKSSLLGTIAKIKLGEYSPSDWQALFDRNDNNLLYLSCYFSFINPKKARDAASIISSEISKISMIDYRYLESLVRNLSKNLNGIEYDVLAKIMADKSLCARYRALVFWSMTYEQNKERIELVSDSIFLSVPGITDFILHTKIDRFLSTHDESDLEEVKRLYSLIPADYSVMDYDDEELPNFPEELARHIMENVVEYPRSIVSTAELSLRAVSIQKQQSIGDIAQHENWFVS